MTDYKAIFAIGIFAMLALAGVAVLADDASAEGDATGPAYKVTYKYGESSIVDKTEAGGTYSFKAFDKIGFTAPEGYEFKQWRDASSSATYQVATNGSTGSTPAYTFAGDVTVIPEFKLDGTHSEIVLTYGDISETYLVSSSSDYTLSEEQLGDFGKKIGMEFEVGDENNISLGKDAKFEFNGFIGNAESKITKLTGIKGEASKTVEYTLDASPIYNVYFIVNGAITDSCKSNVFVVPKNADKPNYDFVGWSDGTTTYNYDPALGDKVVIEDYKFVKDVTFTAVFKEKVYDATFIIGDKTEVRSAKYNKPVDAVPLPEGYAYYALADDETKTKVAFPYTVTGPVTFVAIEGVPAVTFNVTFQIEGKTDVTQKSDSLTIPDVTREGYEFQGWVVAGTSKYVDPTKYEYTADVTFVAIYKQIGYSTVTFIIGEEVIEISVKNGTTIPADKIPELDPAVYSGWNFDINMVIDQSQSFKAVPILYHKVVFEYGADTGIPSVTVEVADGTTIPADKIPVIPAQLGDVRWDYSNSTVRDDMTIGLVDVVYPEEPGFFDTTSGKIAGAIILLAVLVVIALLVAPASPMNYKIVKGKVAGVIEARRADKKP